NDVALVTGAGQGIGQGIAYALAERGARVAVAGRTQEKLEITAKEIIDRGGEAEPFCYDITEGSQIESLIEDVVGHFGGLNILVNNAHNTLIGDLLSFSEEDYKTSMDSGPLATWRLMRACHPHLEGRGAILNMGSSAGVRWNPSGYGGYGAAKEAIRTLTRVAACEWADDGIRVNAILPLGLSPA